MQLTLQTDYSLRLLLYLSVVEEATIGEVAAYFQVSKHHLVKVAHHLGKGGYLHTTRGRRGGLRLAVPPKDVCLGAVVRHTEPHFHLVACFDPEGTRCAIQPVCRLKHVLAQAHHAFIEVLDSYTLHDLLEDRRLLASLLQGREAVPVE